MTRRNDAIPQSMGVVAGSHGSPIAVRSTSANVYSRRHLSVGVQDQRPHAGKGRPAPSAQVADPMVDEPGSGLACCHLDRPGRTRSELGLLAFLRRSLARGGWLSIRHTRSFVDASHIAAIRRSPTPVWRSGFVAAGDRDQAFDGTMIIHETPNWSATAPKRLAKNVGPIGICTVPSSASAP